MGHPIRNDALDAKVREMRANGGSISGIARSCGIGVNRVRRIIGLPLPPSQRPSGLREYVKVAERPQQTEKTTMKSITIPLTDTAHERLAEIADTAYLSPEAFAATLIASYLSYQPEQIVLQPREPELAEDDDAGEDEDESGGDDETEGEAGEEDAEEDEPEEREPRPPEEQFAWIQPGRYAILVEGEDETLVKVAEICPPYTNVKSILDKVRVKRPGGAIVEVTAGELDLPPDKGSKRSGAAT